MSIKGRDFLLAAAKSLETNHESGYRSAASRAYYGFYHEVCGVLKNCPPTTHDGVVKYLSEGTSRNAEPYEKFDMIQLGAVLGQQKKKRKKADYELNDEFSQSEAESSISAVQKMLTKIDAMKQKVT